MVKKVIAFRRHCSSSSSSLTSSKTSSMTTMRYWRFPSVAGSILFVLLLLEQQQQMIPAVHGRPIVPTTTAIITTKASSISRAFNSDVLVVDDQKANNNNKKTDDENAVLLEFLLHDLRDKYEHYQPTFLQAVEEMAKSLLPLFRDPNQGNFYQRAFMIMTEPERIIAFRVPWIDDQGHLQINRGWRVEFSRYGGLRFHPTVNEDVLKFLGFEQVFKNALTGLPMGGGKGGSDFDPKHKSEHEIRRFCQSFMTELFRYLHPSTDVPAGDMGVGSRELGYLYGQYKRLTNRHGDEGVLTGKSMLLGGSPLRPEATGYGLVYMAQLALQKKFNKGLQGLRCAVSGSGNVAQYACDKLLELGAKVITVSDSNGVLVFDNDGMTRDDWNAIMECKNEHRGRLSSLQGKVTGRFIEHQLPWTLEDEDENGISFDVALPCATQNEIDDKAARLLIKKGVQAVLEGANLPTTLQGQDVLRQNNILYIPGKASNAGGVGVSGLEMSQNAQRLTWSREDVDQKLQDMMANIYQLITEKEGHDDGNTSSLLSFEEGANRASFIKVARAMKELGWIY